MSVPEDSARPSYLAVEVDEARRYALLLAQALGRVVWVVKEAKADAPDVGSIDPAFAAVSKSLNNALGDAEENAADFARRMAAALTAVFAGVVTFEEVEAESARAFRKIGGELA